ncbi:acid phosphatase [Colletotrichum graminicola]|uniref:Acid phosphatase n=1 Tax=Colletotrichum graminicola (strain M1.001 / M2 / FGSC 10212) TaxID=645133 RepID=E3QKL5_COLGM|nr:acid phosphatase [Colletotrichum graminicola M1.001]EFQ31403.1 acid phosphatase [Colletotrichum graminicola M1.001]WDK19681.1 acid phosphatase [Colletotrichum graminicola]
MAPMSNLGLKAAIFLLPFADAASPADQPYARDGLTWSAGAVRMNHVQVIGTHNSYHREAPLAEHPTQAGILPNVQNYYYSHPALDVQATYQSIRNFELDLFADPAGGHYATPLIRKLANLSTAPDSDLLGPGTKVLHVADADYHTTCKTLVGCLGAVQKWSAAHPDHVPIPFMIEFKTAEPEIAAAGGASPIPWNDTALLQVLDSEIRSVFAPGQLVVPDDLRRGNLTLEQSVLQHGWPDLESARGRVLFLMDNGPVHPVRDAYTDGRPNLEGRVLFTNSAPGNPDCAFQKLNDPTGAEQANIRAQVQADYWVRTRADVPLDTLLSNDTTAMREAAFSSGAQIVSTDFQAYGMSTRWDVDYAVRFAGGAAARCNPVNAGAGCVDAALEPVEYVRN